MEYTSREVSSRLCFVRLNPFVNTRRLGKYEIVERLGRGGMAEVYRAYHASLDRYVAIKVLHKFLADDPEFKSRFEREAQNIARLKHPHIVQVYDFDYDPEDDSYYMVMELVEGETLKDRLFEFEKKGELITLEEALRTVREAASALAYAHRGGMIHRDVKPANLMLDNTEDGRVVLTDFGIAKIITSSQFTVTGGLIGTPAYMSPEQGVGESGDERSDLYALGVILYQMLTGELPYDADTPLALILKHVNEAIPSASMVNPQLPSRVDDIVEKLMAKDLDSRYQTATEVIEDLEQLEADLAEGNVLLGTDAPPPVVLPIKPTGSSVGVDQPTVRFRDLEDMPTQALDTPTNTQIELDPVTDHQASEQPQSRVMLWLLGVILGGIIIGGGYVAGANNGMFPAIAFLASETPTATITPTQTPEPTETIAPTDTLAPTETTPPTDTAIPTETETPTRTPTATEHPTETPTVTAEPSDTPEPSETPTPSGTPNLTQTFEVQRAATMSACTFDYAVISQEPEDGEEGGFIETNSPYVRTIILLNTGTCDWERNTSLTFIEGEDFNAGPRIFIREPVEVGEEITLEFSGMTPNQGRVENGEVVPVEGTWRLRTPEQFNIGTPLTISVLVFDPGN